MWTFWAYNESQHAVNRGEWLAHGTRLKCHSEGNWVLGKNSTSKRLDMALSENRVHKECYHCSYCIIFLWNDFGGYPCFGSSVAAKNKALRPTTTTDCPHVSHKGQEWSKGVEPISFWHLLTFLVESSRDCHMRKWCLLPPSAYVNDERGQQNTHWFSVYQLAFSSLFLWVIHHRRFSSPDLFFRFLQIVLWPWVKTCQNPRTLPFTPQNSS